MRHRLRPLQRSAPATMVMAGLFAALLALPLGTAQARSQSQSQPPGGVHPRTEGARAQQRCVFRHGRFQQLMRNGDDRGCGTTAWRSRRHYSYDDVAVIAPRRQPPATASFSRIDAVDG